MRFYFHEYAEAEFDTGRLHQDELMANWKLVMNGEEPFRIQPLQ